MLVMYVPLNESAIVSSCEFSLIVKVVRLEFSENALPAKLLTLFGRTTLGTLEP